MKKMGIAVLSALVAAAAFPQQALYDVVIHDGMIVDGTGNPWYRADIGITGGRIQKIGTIPPSAGRKAINASGRAVSPGFIDLHTHSDIPVLVDGTAQSAVRQGDARCHRRERIGRAVGRSRSRRVQKRAKTAI